MPEVTSILNAIERGDPAAAAQLWPVVYDELRQLAGQLMMRERPGQILSILFFGGHYRAARSYDPYGV